MNDADVVAILEGWLDDGRAWGVVSATTPDGPVFLHAAGYANVERGEAIEEGTRFACASVGKAFTAAAVMTLVERGQLSLDGSVTALLPGRFPGLHPAVSIEHLLTHTSGIADYVDEIDGESLAAARLAEALPTLRAPADYLPLFVDRPPRFAPGAEFAYCNAGYALLGCVIEEVSGCAYDEFVGDAVFGRCGMADSGFHAVDGLPSVCALGYVEGAAGSLHANTASIPVVGGADGGVFVTAGDLSCFWRALARGDLPGLPLHQAHRWPQRPVPHLRPRCTYTMGLYRVADGDRTPALCAAGSDPGVNALTALFPRRGLAVTILSNRERPVWSILAELMSLTR